MNTKRFSLILISFVIGILLVVSLPLLASFQASSVKAAPDGVTRYVSLAGSDGDNDCTDKVLPCRTVKHVITIAQADDEILVSAGTYTDTMFDPRISMGVSATVIITKNISKISGGYSPDFESRNVLDYETILSAKDSPGAHVLVLSDTNVVVDGFTLTGVLGARPPDPNFVYYGGAVRVRGGSPTISHNYITENQAFSKGGGIYIGSGASPFIFSNTIISNTIIYEPGNATSDGGGISVDSGPTVITGNSIVSNTVQFEGGGIYVGWNVPVSIVANSIGYNQALNPDSGRGGGIRTRGDQTPVLIQYNKIYGNSLVLGVDGSGLDIASPAIIDNNYIYENYGLDWRSALCTDGITLPITITNNIIANNHGSGVKAINVRDIRVLNNTIVGNTWMGMSTMNWPFTSTVPYTLTMFNNVVVDNVQCGINSQDDFNLLIDYNDVYGNGNDYCSSFATPGVHDINADPMFLNPSISDYRLSAGSPAINSGNNAYAPPTDFEGVHRPQGLIVDIGAYEYKLSLKFLPLALK
jgi:parallel beta-helix repeat protein